MEAETEGRQDLWEAVENIAVSLVPIVPDCDSLQGVEVVRTTVEVLLACLDVIVRQDWLDFGGLTAVPV